MASDRESRIGGNRHHQETPPPPSQEQESIQEYDFLEAAPSRTHHVPQQQTPPQEFMFPELPPEPTYSCLFDRAPFSESTVEGPLDYINGVDTTSTETLVPPPFHPALTREIAEATKAPVLVFDKRLSSADVSADFNRLFIRKGWRLALALTAHEKGSILGKAGAVIRVSAADSNGVKFELLLAAGPKPMAFVLRHEWIDIVESVGLKKGDRVEGWGYRVGQEFRLALHFLLEE